MRQAIRPQLNPLYASSRRNIFVFLLLFLLFAQFDLKASLRKYDETVSLGTACQAAWQLEANEMRKWAYPFDWLVTPFDSLIAFIANRGVGFLEKNNLQVIEVLQGNPSMLHVADSAYGIHSIHDFYFPDMPNYDHVKAKYERRIQRFFELLASDKKILFVRVQMNRNEAMSLDNFLHNLYPQLEYTLLVISDDLDAQSDWGLERIKNFYMEQHPAVWAGNAEKWKEILSQFPVKKSKKKRPDEEKW